MLRSDEIRKRQHGVPPEQRLPNSAYGEAASEAVLGELTALVTETAMGGHAVIADATFIDPRDRSRLAAAARAVAVPFLGLWLQAPLAELETRIAERNHDASDATIAVLHAVSRGNPGPGDWTAVEAIEPTQTEAQARLAIRSARSDC